MFSVEFVEDHSEEELEAGIRELPPKAGIGAFTSFRALRGSQARSGHDTWLMAERTVEDRLREEYFLLLPDVRRILEELEAAVRHCLLPLSSKLDKYERLVVSSRIKDCESALDALRRRREGAIFDSDQPGAYTLTALNDLAGVRVLAFPRSRLMEAGKVLRTQFFSWISDPVPADDESEGPLAFKYQGCCVSSTKVRAELRIVPMLSGLFWQIEHSTIYKPTPQLKGVVQSLEMRQRTSDILRAPRTFENEFEL